MSYDKKKNALRNRRAPIEMSADEFRTVGHKLVDEIAEFIDSIRNRPVNYDESPGEVRRLLPQGGLPESGTEPSKLFAEVAPLLFDHSLLNGHPRFYGYVTSSAAPIGALADMLAASINPNLGGWQLSPVASEIERQSVQWIAELIDGELSLLSCRATGEGRLGYPQEGHSQVRRSHARLRHQRDPYVDPEGDGSFWPRHRRDSGNTDRQEPLCGH
jgi:hypothetical protein